MTSTNSTSVALEDLPARSRLVLDAVRAAGLELAVHQLPDSTRTARAAADALGCDVGAIASSLLFLADGEPLLVMTSGAHRVDTELLAGQIGASKVTMANAAQVRSVTGQAIGGVAPVGHPAPVRTVIDGSLAQHAKIWTAAGTPHTLMPMTYGQLLHLTGGSVVEVARD